MDRKLPRSNPKRRLVIWRVLSDALAGAEFLTQEHCNAILRGLRSANLVADRRSEDEVRKLVESLRGLPAGTHLTGLLEIELHRWLPALLAGYRWGPPGSDIEAEVPLQLRLTNPCWDADKAAWHIEAEVVGCFDQGWRFGQLVAPRLAARLLTSAVGVKAAYSLDRPRPYDLHNLQLAACVSRTHRTIFKVLTFEELKRPNRRLAAPRLADCTRGRVKGTCRLCGLADTDCPLARSTTKSEKAECRCCGQTRLSAGRGVCIECVEHMVRRGTPPIPRPNRPGPNGSTVRSADC